MAFPGFHSVRAFAEAGPVVVAAGAGTIARRDPGSGRWHLEASGLGRFQTSVASDRRRFFVVGHNGEMLRSVDGGTTWTAVATGVTQNLDAVSWTGRRFVAVGEGVAIESADGLRWRSMRRASRSSLRALVPFRTDAGSRLLAVGDLGTRVVLAP